MLGPSISLSILKPQHCKHVGRICCSLSRTCGSFFHFLFHICFSREFFFNRLCCSNQILLGVRSSEWYASVIKQNWSLSCPPNFKLFPSDHIQYGNPQQTRKSHHLHLPKNPGTINSPLAAVHREQVRSRNAAATAPSKN